MLSDDHIIQSNKKFFTSWLNIFLQCQCLELLAKNS